MQVGTDTNWRLQFYGNYCKIQVHHVRISLNIKDPCLFYICILWVTVKHDQMVSIQISMRF